MKEKIYHIGHGRMTDQHDSRPEVFLFFAHAHFLKTILWLTHIWHIGICPTRKANASQKPKSQIFPRSVWVLCILTMLFSVDSYGQIQTPQTPTFGTFTPITPNQNSPTPRQPTQQDIQNQKLIQQSQQQQYRQQQQQRELYNDLHENDYKKSASPSINYAFPSLASVQGASIFYKAYKSIDSMLLGQQPLNLKKAVFLVENAYDNTLSYSKFNGQIKYIADVCRQKMLKDGIAPDNREGVNMIIYQVLCDTVDVQNPRTKVYYRSFPYLYDFTDFRGEEDITKMFVSKLLRTHKGNCHSMPLLYLILAEELKTQAFLNFAPQHSFVRFQDNKGNWLNVELTNGRLSSDAWVLGSGFIKAEALNSKIYLDTIDKKQTIAFTLFDLSKNYITKIGMDEFVLKCSNRLLEVFPNSIFGILEKADYYTALSMYIANQKGRPTKEQIKKDQRAWASFQKMYEMYDVIDNSGYVDMPKDAYEQWRKSEDNGK